MIALDSHRAIDDLARGAVFLGAGGGGDPYIGALLVKSCVARGRTPRLIPLDHLDDDAFVVSLAGVGAPTVIVEYLASVDHLMQLIEQAQKTYGRKIDALISAEIGGINSMFPLAAAAMLDIPIVDADGMGRAFPKIEMTTFSIGGLRSTPAVVSDESGNCLTLDLVSDALTEAILRPVVGELGAMVMTTLYPMSGRDAKRTAVAGTISEAFRIGRTISAARTASDDVFAALLACLDDPVRARTGRLLFDGKIADVIHETRDGWHWGLAKLAPLDGGEACFTVEVQNEYIIARHAGRTVTSVPDILAILDRESAEPLTGEMLRYGQRVKVIGYSAHPALTTRPGLERWGPRGFGIDEEFVALGTVET